MKVKGIDPEDDVGFTSKWLMLTFILIGLVLILVSFAIPHEGGWNYLRDIFRELGVVVSSVFTVSFLNERLIAKKYVKQFLTLLRELIEQGERNAAMCARLGVIQIFYTRDTFEREYPIADLASKLNAGSHLHIVAQTLYHLMSKTGAIRTALEQGATIEFCIFDPGSPESEVDKHPDLLVSDIHSAVSIFKKQIGEWVEKVKPPGRVELRYHQVPIFDSFLSVVSDHQSLMVWDLGFGRDVTEKRIFLVDPAKTFGKDLARRYGFVWEAATPVFKYDGEKVCIDALSTTELSLPPGQYSLTSPKSEKNHEFIRPHS